MLLWVIMWKIWGASFIFLWMKIILNAIKEREPFRERRMFGERDWVRELERKCWVRDKVGCEELVWLWVVLSWEGSWGRGVWELWRVG